MRKVGIMQMARLGSTRLKSKLLEKINGKTLVEIGLEHMASLRSDDVVPTLCILESDTQLRVLADKYAIDVIYLHPDCEHTKAYTPEIHVIPLIKPLSNICDWVWMSNILCHPYSSLTTSQIILDKCKTSEMPFVTTIRKRGIVWNYLGCSLIGQGQMADTMNNPTYYELAHYGYGLPVDFLALDNSHLSDLCESFPINLSWSEKIDIDTIEDLEHACAVSTFLSGKIKQHG